ARTLGGVVAATGPVDVVSDGRRVAHIANGDPWLARVTGTGCSLSALVGAFVAVTDKQQRRNQALDAVVAALVTFEVAAEKARAASLGPGTFHAALMDALFTMTPDEVDARAQVTWR
ncbi:MAG: hydroxyethylthiazole kinase, partial [Clostridia bacterium]